MTITSELAPVAVQGRAPAEGPSAVVRARERQDVAAPGMSAFDERAQKTADREPDGKTVQAAVVSINEYLQNERRTLTFSVDDESGRMVVTVTDAETEQVIRQIPPEEILVMARRIRKEGEDAARNGMLLREIV